MKLTALFSLLFFCDLFFSCKKNSEKNTIDPGNNGNVINAGMRLVGVYCLDTTKPVGSDTSYKTSLKYNADGRIRERRYVSSSNIIMQENYFYSANDSLPYKLIKTSNRWSYWITEFLFYTNGVVSKDSILLYLVPGDQLEQTQIRKWTPNGDNTFLEGVLYDHTSTPAIPYPWSGLIFTSKQNGNIVAQIDTSTYFLRFASHSLIDATYDNQINPYYKILPRYSLLSEPIKQKNNNTEFWFYERNGNLHYHLKYAYKYRQDGYPISYITTYMGPNGPSPAYFGNVYFVYE